MRCQVPVLFLVFNRPRQTREVLARLQQARPPRLYIHSDGPRPDRADEALKVEEVRAVIDKGVDWECEIKTIYRTENQGLRNGVYQAISWFFEHESSGIILEDDCVPDLSFFPFCEEILERYCDDEQVMHIGCSNLIDETTSELHESYLFTRFSFVWGWAGWRRAWEKMLPDLEGLERFEQEHKIRSLVADEKAQEYMLDKFRVTHRRENNSWAYAWFYSILKNNGLCVVPKINLVQNVGVGEEGATNTRGRNTAAIRKAGTLPFPLVHPESKAIDPILEQRFFYATQKQQIRLWFWWLLHKSGLR